MNILKQFEEEIYKFINYLKSIIPENKQEEFNGDLENIKNPSKILSFLIGIHIANVDKTINDFIMKYNIQDEERQKLTDYYNMFKKMPS